MRLAVGLALSAPSPFLAWYVDSAGGRACSSPHGRAHVVVSRVRDRGGFDLPGGAVHSPAVAGSYIVRVPRGAGRFATGSAAASHASATGHLSRAVGGPGAARLDRRRARGDACARPRAARRDRSSAAETVRAAAEAWRSSRLDVSVGTDATYAVSIGRILPTLGSLELTSQRADLFLDGRRAG
jgi:hypothetical protein